MSDPLASLLAGYEPPAPGAGLADRVFAGAIAHPQEAMPAAPVRRRDRRGAWLRRSLVGGAAAFSLAVSSAVAASLAGIELPRPVQTMVDALPLVGKMPTPPPEPTPPRRNEPVRRAEAPAPSPPPRAAPTPDPTPRLTEMRQRVEQRRAQGLPTPGADALERQAARRHARGLPPLSDSELEQVLERRAARQQRMQRMRQAREQGMMPQRRFERPRDMAGDPAGPGPRPDIGPVGPRRFDGEALTPQQRDRLRQWREERRLRRQQQMQRWRARQEQVVAPAPVD